MPSARWIGLVGASRAPSTSATSFFEDGQDCTVCTDALDGSQAVSRMRCCENLIHQQCLTRHALTLREHFQGSPFPTCPFCRGALGWPELGAIVPEIRTVYRRAQAIDEGRPEPEDEDYDSVPGQVPFREDEDADGYEGVAGPAFEPRQRPGGQLWEEWFGDFGARVAEREQRRELQELERDDYDYARSMQQQADSERAREPQRPRPGSSRERERPSRFTGYTGRQQDRYDPLPRQFEGGQGRDHIRRSRQRTASSSGRTTHQLDDGHFLYGELTVLNGRVVFVADDGRVIPAERHITPDGRRLHTVRRADLRTDGFQRRNTTASSARRASQGSPRGSRHHQRRQTNADNHDHFDTPQPALHTRSRSRSHIQQPRRPAAMQPTNRNVRVPPSQRYWTYMFAVNSLILNGCPPGLIPSIEQFYSPHWVMPYRQSRGFLGSLFGTRATWWPGGHRDFSMGPAY